MNALASSLGMPHTAGVGWRACNKWPMCSGWRGEKVKSVRKCNSCAAMVV